MISKRSSGFTLLETLVAMVIMFGGVMVLANAWSGNFARIKMARVNNTMAGLLERKMTEYEVLTKERDPSEIPEADGGDFGPKFPGYRWEVATRPFEMPDLSNALIAREGGADEMLLQIVRSSTEYFRDAVKELTVTVFYKRSDKEISAKVTTYIVDYTKQVSLPGMGGGAPAK
jgi:type II secretory pathway pseudopilin PulG